MISKMHIRIVVQTVKIEHLARAIGMIKEQVNIIE